MIVRTIIATALLFRGSVLAQEDLFCPFPCFHGSKCAMGKADFSDHPQPNGQPLEFHKEDSRLGKHCTCPPGYTGLRCAKKYKTCNDGQHFCYHGGECVPGLEDEFGNNQFFCDCATAVDDNGVNYVGKYCEIPAAQPCDEDRDVFCVNGGHCKKYFEDAPHRPCRCGPEHDGPHCEFLKGSVPACDMRCHNGGHCRLGLRTFSDGDAYLGWTNTSNYQYCECSPGYYGLQCEIPSSKCGEHHCFNGGTCVRKRGAGGVVKSHCDCNTADTPSVSYAGRYCQYESTSFCEKNSLQNGDLFCVNDGQCKSQGAHLGCDCPEGYHGPICEFHETERDEDYQNCILPCENGGECRKGVKDTSFLDRFGPQLGHLSTSHSAEFEHCVCPSGYTGLRCEHKIEVCDAGQHACFHGSTCVQNGDDHACDCAAGATVFHQLAGSFCEHKSTSICTLNGKPGSGQSALAFCVNNGRCKDFVEDYEDHPGCDCPDGFEGKHCELLKKRVEAFEQEREAETSVTKKPVTSSANNTRESKKGMSTGAVASVVSLLSIVTVMGIGIFVWMRKKQEEHATENEVIRSTFAPEAERRVQPKDLSRPVHPNWQQHDDLVNVEIL